MLFIQRVDLATSCQGCGCEDRIVRIDPTAIHCHFKCRQEVNKLTIAEADRFLTGLGWLEDKCEPHQFLVMMLEV